MNTQVLGRAASIQPSVRLIAALRIGALHQSIDDQIGDPAQDLIDQLAA